MGKKIIMKILLVIAMFGAVKAAPEAEADPAVLYGGHYGYGLGHYGYGLGGYYGGYYSHPTAVQAGLPYANGWTDGPNNGVGPVVHAIGKREAEAEADPAVLYAGAYGLLWRSLWRFERLRLRIRSRSCLRSWLRSPSRLLRSPRRSCPSWSPLR